jgi:hypothetical protein
MPRSSGTLVLTSREISQMADRYNTSGGTKDRLVSLINEKWDDTHESFSTFLSNCGFVGDSPGGREIVMTDDQVINKLEQYRPLVPA